MNTAAADRRRCLLVGVAASGAWLLALRLLTPLVTTPPGPAGAGFDQSPVRLSALVALPVATWLWIATLLVLVQALGPRRQPLPGVPRSVQRLVLGACGLGLAGGLVAGPAAAAAAVSIPVPDQPTQLLAGLPRPERPGGETRHGAASHATTPPAAQEQRTVTVRPGDTLWELSERDLPAGASAATVSARSHRIHARNADVIGPDPDLLQPGQQLRLPPTEPTTPREPC